MALLYSLSEIRSPLLDSLAMFFTTIAQETTVIVVICALYWCVNKRAGVVIAISYFISGLLIQGLKITFRIDRPWVLDPSFKPVPEAIAGATGYSFPSGHTQSGTALFGTLGFLSRKKSVLALCSCMFFLIGMSRMILGVHTPLDVFTSMALTLLVCGLVSLWFSRNEGDDVKPLWLGIFALFSISLIAYALILQHKGIIEPHYALDCIKTSGAGLGFAVGLYIEQSRINFETSTPKLWMQPVKLALGLGVLMGLKTGFKAAFGQNAVAAFISYFVIVLWIIALYPLVIKKLFSKKTDENA